MTALLNVASKPLTADGWVQACKHLAHKDRVLRRLVPESSGPMLRPAGCAFAILVRTIVWQQLSLASAQLLWRRFVALPGATHPQALLALSGDALRAIHLPLRKIGYLKDLAQLFVQHGWDGMAWAHMADADIAERLLAVRGLGQWNAEMFLIFQLYRPNVLPISDAALLQGISAHYFSGDPVSRSDVREVAQAWQPFSSVAAWLIWQSQNAMPMGLGAD